MSENNKGQKRHKHPKSYYINQAKKRKRQFVLEAGLSGVLVTCMNKERNCIHEAYNLLNEYADKLYGPEQIEKNDGSQSNSDDEDIQKSLEREVKAMQEQPVQQRRFQVVESSVTNCLFIKSTVENPCHLIHTILSDIVESGASKSRYIQRMLPVSVTCKAHPKDVVKAAEPIIEQYFGASEPEVKTYYITTRARNNTSTDLKQVLPDLVSLMQSKYSRHKVDYKTPELVISVEVLCKVACISILKDFNRLRKYNLQEVAAVIFKNNKNLIKEPSDLQGTASEKINTDETIQGDDKIEVINVKVNDEGEVKTENVTEEGEVKIVKVTEEGEVKTASVTEESEVKIVKINEESEVKTGKVTDESEV